MKTSHSMDRDEGLEPAGAKSLAQLSKGILDEIGLIDLPDSVKKDLFAAFIAELELEVGTRIAAQLSSEELDEFEELIAEKDDESAILWLSAHVVNYTDIARQEIERKKDEVVALAPTILSRFAGSDPLQREGSL